MKKNIKLILLTFIILTNSLILSGCWNYREINDLFIVTGIAIDKNQNKDGYILSIETIAPKGVKAGEMLSSTITVEGKTVFDAIRNSIQISGKKMYWSHSKVIVVSEEIAREGVIPILDFFNRSIEVRSDIWLLVSLNKTAKEILNGKDVIHNTISYHINDVISSEKSISKYTGIKLFQFLNALSSKGISPIAPTAKMETLKDMVVPKISGTAVFKRDKMVGWLNETETRSLVIIEGKKFKGSIILIENVLDSDVDITFEVFGSRTKIKSLLENDNIVIDINVEMNVEISEVTQSSNKEDFISKEGREKLKKFAGEVIKKQIEETIVKVQNEYKSDVFGFGTIIQIEHPDKWKEVEDDWEEVFSSLGTNINVELTIQGSSLNSKPIEVN